MFTIPEKAQKLLTSQWFFAGLFLLLVNDFILKQAFGNWFTGKLSDFAGLFIFPLFFSGLFPKRRKVVYFLTAILFVLWKSPLSQPFIDAWNEVGLFNIGRVVDAWDLLGLLSLPLAYWVEGRQDLLRVVRVPVAVPLLLGSFAFVATSYSTEVPLQGTYTFPMSQDSLENRWKTLEQLSHGKGSMEMYVDTTWVSYFVFSDVCFDGFELTVKFHELATDSVQVELIQAMHRCPEDESYRKQILTALVEVLAAMQEK